MIIPNTTDPVFCGVDEVGRGAAVGDIFAAACILPHDCKIPVRDSKRLSARKREILALQIRKEAVAWSIGRVNHHTIDSLNVHRASLLAMERAVQRLQIAPDVVLVDGKYPLSLAIFSKSIVGGDDLVPAISAASILAKVARDAYMVALDRQFPGYFFAKNKGYLTGEHRKALYALGPCAEHRLHYRPVQQAVDCCCVRTLPSLFDQNDE